MNKPFFSVITATYNSEETIAHCIESLLAQTFTNFEYIVVDGNSKDCTVEIAKSYAHVFAGKNIKFTFVSEPDKGVYDAWNKGLKLSAGQWISFLGSDDEYLTDALFEYHKQIGNHPEANYISSRVELINANREKINELGNPYIWEQVVRDIDMAQVGSFHKRELFDVVGNFNHTYKIVGDLEFYLRSKDVIRPAYFPRVTARMQNGGISNQIYVALKEARDVKLKFKVMPTTKVNYYFYSSVAKAYIKRWFNKK